MTSPADNDHLDRSLPDNFSTLFLETELSLLGQQVRTGLPIGIALYLCFSGLDWLVAPELFKKFLLLRLVAIIFPVAMIPLSKTGFAKERVRVLTLITFLIGATSMIAMCVFLGGFASNYFVGLILMMFFVGLFLPWGLVNSFIFLVLTNFGYFGVCIYKNGGFENSEMPIAFMLGSAVLTHLAASMMQKSRRRAFIMRLQLEQANSDLQELDRAKSKFFSNINHELRTPLMLILGPLELMMRGDKVNQQRMFKSMSANARRLLRQVNSILTLSKLDADKLQCRRELCSLSSIIDELVIGAQPFAEQRNISLEHEGIKELPPLPLDPEHIETVFANFISNALKFSPNDTTITISGELERNHVRVTVKDEGRGISAEQLPYVFERFHQAPEDLGGKTQGTGLGLALAKDLVEMHGGSIEAQSKVNAGATFTVLLPTLEASDWSPQQEVATSPTKAVSNLGYMAVPDLPDNAQLEAAPLNAPRILIVEDNPDMRSFLATALATKYRVLTAEDGKAGLATARREHPDVILSDVQMPIMDGFAMLAELRKDNAFDRTPVLMLTAHSESSAMVESLELGAVDYIHKPFKLAEVEARVAAHLRTITMLEEIDERDSRLVAVGQIASTLAHDMRGPLTVIINRAELLRVVASGGEENKEIDSEISAIEQSVRRVNSMIQELLEFVSGREVVLEQTVTTVEELLAPVAAESQMALQHSGIEWSFLMQGGSSKLLVDHHRFARIIENIINNARDALLSSKHDSPKVDFHADANDSHLVLRISDNGPGIPDDIATTLFQPYSTAGKAQGHGLGLAIVRNLVTANGGSVELDATVESGTSFVIRLPLL